MFGGSQVTHLCQHNQSWVPQVQRGSSSKNPSTTFILHWSQKAAGKSNLQPEVTISKQTWSYFISSVHLLIADLNWEGFYLRCSVKLTCCCYATKVEPVWSETVIKVEMFGNARTESTSWAVSSCNSELGTILMAKWWWEPVYDWHCIHPPPSLFIVIITIIVIPLLRTSEGFIFPHYRFRLEHTERGLHTHKTGQCLWWVHRL